MSNPKPEDKDIIDHNDIGKTLAKLVVSQDEQIKRQQKCILDLVDLAFQSGAEPKDIERSVKLAGYVPCSECKYSGNYPSDYLKLLCNVNINDIDYIICKDCEEKKGDE